jgi:hypothetical protein
LGTVAAAGLLAGCSGAQTGGLGNGAGVTPSAQARSLAERTSTATTVHVGMARVNLSPSKFLSPDKKSKKGYVYINDSSDESVDVYAFAKGKIGKEVGSTTSGISEPQGACSNGKKNVAVSNTGLSETLIFVAPKTTSSGSVSSSGYYPVGCAYDSKGDLAVSNIESTSGGNGNIQVFKGAAGSPSTLTCPNVARYFFLSYDKAGDIYADGENSSGYFAMCVVPAGDSTGEAVSLSSSPGFPGGVQVVGNTVNVTDQDSPVIDQYSFSGTTGTLTGTISLGGDVSDANGTWISGKYLVASSYGTGTVYSYKYPAGGTPLSTVTGFATPQGVAIAK